MPTVDPDGILTPAERRTAKKHHVEAFWTSGRIMVQCLECGAFWEPLNKPGAGKWWRGWWACERCSR